MDESSDWEHRLPPSSSALLALETLSPPTSPAETSFQLLYPSASGEIPIFLSPALADVVLNRPEGNIGITENVDEDKPEYDQRVGSIWPSNSANSALTFNTFGIPTAREKQNLLVPLHEASESNISLSACDTEYILQDDLDEQRSHIEENIVLAFSESSMHAQSLGTTSNLSLTAMADYKGPHDSLHNGEVQPSLRYRYTSASGLVGSSAAAALGEPRGVSLEPSILDRECLSHILQSSHDLESKHSRRKLAIAATLAALEARSTSAPSSPVQPSYPCIRSSSFTLAHHPPLPLYMARLMSSSIDLLIDQEGFRSAVARFQVYAIQDPDLTPPHRQEMAGMVLFKPIQRQRFPFHYAPIEAQPILRRLTIEDEPSRDYLSRQASLCLKSNGVYSVRGTERSALATSDSEGHDEARNYRSCEAKLSWLFEYSVDDRPIRSLGTKIFEGEKVLTPLSFACSPLLLHPVQGRKIRLMHVIKKALAPNITSEKLLPPANLLSPVPPMNYDQSRARPSQFGSGPNCRAQSFQANQLHSQRLPDASPPRRHVRASSADVHARSQVQGEAQAQTGRHIIPPSQLAELFDAESGVSTTTPNEFDSEPRPLSYVPLTPRPRFRPQNQK